MHAGISSLSKDRIETTTTPATYTIRNNKNHAALFVVVLTFFPSIWGRGELKGGGGREMGKGGVSGEKNITQRLECGGGVHSGLLPRVCVWAWAGDNVCWQACRPASWLAVPPAVNTMTRWQQALSIARALSCHRNLPLDTACWLAVSNCCCSVRLMKPRGWGRASGTACSCFPALVESVARHITGQLVNKHSAFKV